MREIRARTHANKKRQVTPRRGYAIYTALVAVGFFLIANSSQNLIDSIYGYSTASAEYNELRELYYMAPAPSPAVASEEGVPVGATEDGVPVGAATCRPRNDGLPTPEIAVRPAASVTRQHAAVSGLIEINPDYVGWITIDGTVIDYPVVRGTDNNHYLDVTFAGKKNPAGAIFIDYRNALGFDSAVCIMYGHNMKNGTMFAALNKFIDPAVMAAHSDITIVTSDGRTLVYRIFAVRRTNMWDEVYSLNFPDDGRAAAKLEATPSGEPLGASLGASSGEPLGAPLGASTCEPLDTPASADHFLVLSTCTPGSDKNERLLVYASLVPLAPP